MNRLLIITFCLNSLLFNAQINNKKQTAELIIIGTIHFPTKQINKDTIYSVLENLKPDIILIESDMTNFNSDFTFKNIYDENEWNAIVKYRTNFKNILFRPMEFEGRNNYRKENGIQNPDVVLNEINVLDSLNILSEKHKKIWHKFIELSTYLNELENNSLKEINSISTENLVRERQFYQYQKLKEIIDENDEFAKLKTRTTSKESISFRELYKRYCYFEELRNRTIIDNILKWKNKYPNKKIVALIGFYHKYFLINELKWKQKEYNFNLKEYNLN
jgi:pheromone shutdown protein TraB